MQASLESRATIAVFTLLLPVGCGGRTGYSDQGQASGASSTGGATSTGLTASTGGDLNTGGASSVNTGVAGCPGQPVARPSAGYPSHNGGCANSQAQGVQVGGIYAAALETFDVSFASTCVYPAPACTPLIAFTSSLGYGDPNNLSVWFSFPDGTAEMYPFVMSADDCTISSGGFYLDSINTMPTTITFCPCTCARLGSIQGTIYVIDFPIIVVG